MGVASSNAMFALVCQPSLGRVLTVVGLHVRFQVFDASKVAVQPVEEANDKKIIATVGSSTHQVRRPAYVEHGLDPEVAAALDNSEGSEFDSADELEDDFVVFANNNPEGRTSGEFPGADSVGLRSGNLRLEGSVVEGDEEEGEFCDEDEDARSGVTTENDRPRASRLLDEQFEKVGVLTFLVCETWTKFGIDWYCMD